MTDYIEAAMQFGFEGSGNTDTYICTEAQLIAFAKACERAGRAQAKSEAEAQIRRVGSVNGRDALRTFALMLGDTITKIDAELAPILTPSEIQSGLTRQRWAELLIEQLPNTHDGRNTWLTNYGMGAEAYQMRHKRGLKFDQGYQAVQP